MADLSITAANVKHKSGPKGSGLAGATITAGQALYLDTADNRLKLADADALASSRFVGVALHGASAEQPLDYAAPGAVVDLGAGTQSLIYIVSGTAGGLSPHTDTTTPASGEYLTVATVCMGNSLHRVVGYGNADAALA